MNIHIASFYLPNFIRYITILLLLTVLVLLPKAIGHVRAPSRRGWLFITAIELIFIGQIGLVFDRLNYPLYLFGTPISFLSSAMLTIYCIAVLHRGD